MGQRCEVCRICGLHYTAGTYARHAMTRFHIQARAEAARVELDKIPEAERRALWGDR